MKKLLLSFLLLLHAPGLTFAQTEGEVFELPISWKVGETHMLALKKSREQHGAGSKQFSYEGSAPIKVEVLEKSDSGFVIRWTYGKFEVSKGPQETDQLLAKLANIAENLRLEFRTSELGLVTSLVNKQETAELYQEALEVVLRSMRQKGHTRGHDLETDPRNGTPCKSRDGRSTGTQRTTSVSYGGRQQLSRGHKMGL